jgi:predicted RNA binding protein YcfA (HicA-like mRNA interferase family)
MKRSRLIRHLEKRGCVFIREGGSHTIYKNSLNGKMTSIPRHRKLKNFWRKRSATIWEFSVRKIRD